MASKLVSVSRAQVCNRDPSGAGDRANSCKGAGALAFFLLLIDGVS